ncbi:MAG: hypothetical protein KAR47_01905, partial [Planctomycetes bacterium]|nr:hypothetical protein [Planctomycetota bacterium]
ILKVYNELCRENLLKIERGDGTYVSSAKQTISPAERKKVVATILREAIVQAIHLDISREEARDLLGAEYDKIVSQRNAHQKTGSAEK